MSYRLVTDATADLAPEMLEGLPEISVLPMEILLDGRPYTYGPVWAPMTGPTPARASWG